MSILSDPLLARLRSEAEDWHLSQSGTVTRHSAEVVGGRDVDTEVLVYSGPLGVKRERSNSEDTQAVVVELPVSAAPIHPGDVVYVNGMPDPFFVSQEHAPVTANAAILKIRCQTRTRTPRSPQ